MELKKWLKIYDKLITEFGFSKEEDEYSAKMLSCMISAECAEKALSKLKGLIDGKVVFVIGASDEACVQIRALKKGKGKYSDSFLDFEKSAKISADGATSALVSEGIIPEVIVTDLDGDIEIQFEAFEKGSIIVIHAHGDNKERIKEYVPEFIRRDCSRVLGTTQTKPEGSVYNFGGFTDGDRAVHLAYSLGAKKIILVGFDFTKIGKYSYLGSVKPTLGKGTFEAWKRKKMKKLSWARRLIFDYVPEGLVESYSLD